jgi:hypothetical protein
MERSIDIGSGLPIPIHNNFCCEFEKVTRDIFNLPRNGFLLCFPSRPGRVPKKQMSLWFTLLANVPNSFLVLIPRPDESLGSLWDALSQFNSEVGIHGSILDKERIIIRRMSDREQEYVALLSLTDLCVDSSAHGLTSAACRGVLCLDMPDSDSRSHAAVVHMSAVGLRMFVATNVLMYLEKGVKFANDKKLQKEVGAHLSKQKDHFRNHWTDAFEEAVAQGIKQFTEVPDNLKDIDIQSSWPIIEFQDGDAIVREHLLLKICEIRALQPGTKAAILRIMIEVQKTGNKLAGDFWVGGSTLTLKCTETSKTDEPFVTKIDLKGVGIENVPDSGCFRGALNGSFAEKKAKRLTRQVVPKMFCIFQDGAFCGHTPPDTENLVYFFHCCAFVDCDLLENQFSEFQVQWQHDGIMSDKFRIFMLRFLEALDLLHSLSLNILDIKFKKFGVDQAGDIMAADLGFSVLHSDTVEILGVSTLQVLNLHSKRNPGSRHCYFRVNKKNNETTFFTLAQLDNVRAKMIQNTEELTCLGIGTITFYDESEIGLRNERRTRYISRTSGCAEDTYQALMCMLQAFHPSESNRKFSKLAIQASSSVETLQNFMKPRSCDVQQEVPFHRFADVIHLGLGPKRLNLNKIICHAALLLIVLEPELDCLHMAVASVFRVGGLSILTVMRN